MNQTFSFARFAHLHRWLWATKNRTYLIGLGTLIVVSCLNLSRITSPENRTYNDGTYESHMVFFVLFAGVLVIGIGSDVFSALFRQESAITYLMIPASRSEKFWLGALYPLAALLIFTGVYFGCEAMAFSVVNGHLKPGEMHYVSSLIQAKPDLANGRTGIIRLFFALLLLLGIMLLGSLYFRRGVVARNVGIVLLLFTGFFLLYQWIVRLTLPAADFVQTSLPFSEVHIMGKNDSLTQSAVLDVPDWLTYAAYGLLFVGFWLTARVRFNEIER